MMNDTRTYDVYQTQHRWIRSSQSRANRTRLLVGVPVAVLLLLQSTWLDLIRMADRGIDSGTERRHSDYERRCVSLLEDELELKWESNEMRIGTRIDDSIVLSMIE